jgi:hypothetical protein
MTMPHSLLPTFPPLRERKHPGLAALIGALTGGVGLAIYFKSVRDLFPVEVAGGLVWIGSLTAGADPFRVAPFVLPVVGGVYGLVRAHTSNRRRAAVIAPTVAVGSAG